MMGESARMAAAGERGKGENEPLACAGAGEGRLGRRLELAWSCAKSAD